MRRNRRRWLRRAVGVRSVRRSFRSRIRKWLGENFFPSALRWAGFYLYLPFSVVCLTSDQYYASGVFSSHFFGIERNEQRLWLLNVTLSRGQVRQSTSYGVLLNFQCICNVLVGSL